MQIHPDVQFHFPFLLSLVLFFLNVLFKGETYFSFRNRLLDDYQAFIFDGFAETSKIKA
jgi:hypothetical protein